MGGEKGKGRKKVTGEEERETGPGIGEGGNGERITGRRERNIKSRCLRNSTEGIKKEITRGI